MGARPSRSLPAALAAACLAAGAVRAGPNGRQEEDDAYAKGLALVESGEVERVVPWQLHGLEGSEGRLEKVVVADLDGRTKSLEADLLLAFYGLRMELGPIAGWGLNLERNLINVDPATCATSTPGIHAIGDIVTYPGKLKLILSGFSEAAMAAHDIHSLVWPDKPLRFEYSTTKGVPGS